MTTTEKKKRRDPLEILKKYYSKDDQEKVTKLGYKIIDLICDQRINHAVLALEIAKRYLEQVIDQDPKTGSSTPK